MFLVNPFFWAGVLLIAIAYWFDLDSPTNTAAFRILLIAYGVTSSIVIYDIRLDQERRFNGRDAGSLPGWTIVFHWIAYACAIALIFISWRAFITIFVVRFILKLLPVLETIGGLLMIPFFRPPSSRMPADG